MGEALPRSIEVHSPWIKPWGQICFGIQEVPGFRKVIQYIYCALQNLPVLGEYAVITLTHSHTHFCNKKRKFLHSV